jgi:hypothetical protein
MQWKARSGLQRVAQRFVRHRPNHPNSLSNRGEVLRRRNRGSQTNNYVRCLQAMLQCC